MIRRADTKDLESLIELAKVSIKENKFVEKTGVEVHEPSLWSMATFHMNNPNRCILLVDDQEGEIKGFLIGMLVIWPYDIRVCGAHVEQVYGENRKELEEEFDRWAKEVEACTVIVSCLEGENRARRI